jgi:hypothetical protein
VVKSDPEQQSIRAHPRGVKGQFPINRTIKAMKLTNHNRGERLLPSSSGQTDKLNQTNFFAQRASKRTRLSFSVLFVLGLGAMAFLSGCTVTVREPGVVVTPPVVAVETPGVVVETPPVMLEEGVGVVFPVGVDFVLVGGRYAWFDVGIGRWYYRPMGWRPPAGYRGRVFHSFREHEQIHHSEMRRQPGARPDVRREEPRKAPAKEAKKPEVRREEPKKAPAKAEKKKQEKKKDER